MLASLKRMWYCLQGQVHENPLITDHTFFRTPCLTKFPTAALSTAEPGKRFGTIQELLSPQATPHSPSGNTSVMEPRRVKAENFAA